MKEKIIKGIRYFESDWVNKDGSSLPSYIGEIYKFHRRAHKVGERIARKLNQYKFIAGSYDHIYINFTTCLREGEVVLSKRHTEGWYIYINCGANPNSINCLRDSEKERLIEELTFKILRNLYHDDLARINLIDMVEEEIKKYGSETEIIYKIKETKSYKVLLSYQICPNDLESCAILEYWDKTNNMTFKKKIFNLYSYEDIYPLVDSISIKNESIIFQPKKSYRAELYNMRYTTPIRVSISELAEP